MQHPDFTWQLALERQARYGAEAGRSRRTHEGHSAVGNVTRRPNFGPVAAAHVDERFAGLSFATPSPRPRRAPSSRTGSSLRRRPNLLEVRMALRHRTARQPEQVVTAPAPGPGPVPARETVKERGPVVASGATVTDTASSSSATQVTEPTVTPLPLM
jgi:hypothetical protein